MQWKKKLSKGILYCPSSRESLDNDNDAVDIYLFFLEEIRFLREELNLKQ